MLYTFPNSGLIALPSLPSILLGRPDGSPQGLGVPVPQDASLVEDKFTLSLLDPHRRDEEFGVVGAKVAFAVGRSDGFIIAIEVSAWSQQVGVQYLPSTCFFPEAPFFQAFPFDRRVLSTF